MNSINDLINLPYIDPSFFKNEASPLKYSDQLSIQGQRALESETISLVINGNDGLIIKAQDAFPRCISYCSKDPIGKSEKKECTWVHGLFIDENKVYVFKEDLIKIDIKNKIEIIRPEDFLDQMNLNPELMKLNLTNHFITNICQIINIPRMTDGDLFSVLNYLKKMPLFKKNENILSKLDDQIKKNECNMTIYRQNLKYLLIDCCSVFYNKIKE